MYKNIDKFIQAIQDQTSEINPIYLRNFRELIKIIPIIGSIIDSNTIGAIQDNMLEERLRNLETSCEKALKLGDQSLLFDEIKNINSIFFILLITNQNTIMNQTKLISQDIQALINSSQNSVQKLYPNTNFKFVTISGASAVGKDCLLNLILFHKRKTNKKIESLTKFTTRPPRIVDSKYYNFVSSLEFDQLERSGNIIFSYFKRGERYGFDRTHLFNSTREDEVLFSVFTHFESLPADRQYLKNQGINHIAILLKADEETLKLRTEGRLLKPNDLEARKRSIEKDLEYINENKDLIENCFDIKIDNSHRHSLMETYNTIVNEVGLPELAQIC